MPELNPKTLPEAIDILSGLIPGKVGVGVSILGGLFGGITKVIPKVTSFLGGLTFPKVVSAYVGTGAATGLAAAGAIGAEHIINNKPVTVKDLKQVAAFGLSAPSAVYTNFVNAGNNYFSDFSKAAGTTKTSIISNINDVKTNVQDAATTAQSWIKANPQMAIAGLAGGTALAAGGYYLANREPSTGISQSEFDKFKSEVSQGFNLLGTQAAMVQNVPITPAVPVAAVPITPKPKVTKRKVTKRKTKAKPKKRKVVKKKARKRKK